MIDSLYPCFKHWSQKGSIWIASDPHFDDLDMDWRKEKINSKDINNYIVHRINDFVNRNDTLIILGDIGNPSYINHLKAGYKILITGNHDKGKSFYQDYFNEIYTGPIWIANKIILSHEPLPLLPALNIHGHLHNDISEEYIDRSAGIKYKDRYYNCALDQHDFKPVNLKTIINSGILKNIDDIHRVTIDNCSYDSNCFWNIEKKCSHPLTTTASNCKEKNCPIKHPNLF